MPNSSFWERVKQHWIGISVILSGIILFFCFVLASYRLNWSWTGFTPSVMPKVQQYQPGKTLWDWMQLLIIPLFLTIGAAWLAARQNHDREIASKQHEHDNQITLDNQREIALQAYIDHMSEIFT
jgi:hypothetical protein